MNAIVLSSMTGFSRSQGSSGPFAFEWELKSVNAKGFDLRLRLPSGWDDVEAAARKRAADLLSRGTVYANLTLKRSTAAPTIKVNEEVLAAVLAVTTELSARAGLAPPSVDGLLAIKGVIEVTEPENDPEAESAARASVIAGFGEALDGLIAMRQREGATLGRILLQRMSELESLAARAEAAPGRRAEAVRARIAEQVRTLLDTSDRFDPDRLAQEALLVAAKADIREELDRIASHVAQARELLGKGGAVGRRLDFLAQEFNREVNTCCSKSNDVELTNIGLEMKSVVEQFREQVQNLE